MSLPFKKYEGLKNDFVIIDLRNVHQEGDSMQWGNVRLHVALCQRHGGIGADGILVLREDENALAHMKITNSDGSTPEMCGNGIRCVGQYLLDQGEVGLNAPFVIQTDAGPKKLIIDGAGIQVDMGEGKPWLDNQENRIWGTADSWKPSQFPHKGPLAWAVDMGNPHLVLDCPMEKSEIFQWGPAWGKHPFFDEGVNVGFSQVKAPNEIELRVWERGAGATWACGTGACAAALAWWQHSQWQGPVKVLLPGGLLLVNLKPKGDDGYNVIMTGPARKVYSGELEDVWLGHTGDDEK